MLLFLQCLQLGKQEELQSLQLAEVVCPGLAREEHCSWQDIFGNSTAATAAAGSAATAAAGVTMTHNGINGDADIEMTAGASKETVAITKAEVSDKVKSLELLLQTIGEHSAELKDDLSHRLDEARRDLRSTKPLGARRCQRPEEFKGLKTSWSGKAF